jgi:hypothetical protein
VKRLADRAGRYEMDGMGVTGQARQQNSRRAVEDAVIHAGGHRFSCQTAGATTVTNAIVGFCHTLNRHA